MNTPAPDWTTLDLAGDGRTLIEASAGTGKTWTICVLYLRLLLERGLSPREVVVTTFTRAAAEELRERLRAQLRRAEAEARVAIGTPAAQASEDRMQGRSSVSAPTADQLWLRARWQADRPAAGRDLARLRLAQAELDLAPIGTLHSLCQRVLADYPFESGAGFAADELIAADDVLDEVARDLWRSLSQGDGDSLSDESLAKVRSKLKDYLKPGVTLWSPQPGDIDRHLPPARAADLRAFAQKKGIWAKTGSGRDRSVLKDALKTLADQLETGECVLKSVQIGHLLNAEGELDPVQWPSLREDPVVVFAQRAGRVFGYLGHAAEIDAWQQRLDRVRDWIATRLQARSQLTYDALIGRVLGALRRPQGTLAARLRKVWPVALVDEFQDTDGEQYGVLEAIYGEDGQPCGRLVMIGDPKQAIYRFRGGDITTYLRAANAVDQTLRLNTNQRSSRAYVDAVNSFYELTGEALSVRPGAPIAYKPVNAGTRRDDTPYTIGGQPVIRPLTLHLRSDVPEAASERRRLALDACAQQIARLLAHGGHAIGGKPVQPGDIAVLLPSNGDVTELRHALQRLGVPCVGAVRSSVFATDLARDLQVLLYAVAHAGDAAAIRAALATPLYGLRYVELAALGDDAPAWDPYERQFQAWRLRWQREGVLSVVRALIDHAAPRLLAGGDGERQLTDLRHLGELLQAQEENTPGPNELLTWLLRQREGEAAGEDAAEERQLRIESDAARVRLMTLHMSKGLEFPIVFLPLMWAHVRSNRDTVPVIHEPLCEARIIGFGAAAKQQYDEEGQDERFRVLYVALTRAIYACHVYLLPPDRPKQAGTEKPGTDPDRSPLDASIERLLERVGDTDTLATLAPALGWSADGWPWRARRLTAPAAEAIRRRALPMPAPRPDTQLYSFSRLSRGAIHGALEDQPASDETLPTPSLEAVEARIAAPPERAHPELQALAGWRGAETGNALHMVFEERVVGLPMAGQHALIERALGAFAVPLPDERSTRAALVERLARRVQATLDATLAPSLVLGALPPRALRAEMGFHYVLDNVSLQHLRDACIRHGEPYLVPPGGPDALRGRMTGKIDLVFEHARRFHVLDYKSNWLGDRLDDYAPASLVTAMDAHHYRFQALLYTVAVDRYLRQRVVGYDRATQLGESLYLFVRAVGLAPDAGVWRHRFDDALVAAVDRVLAGVTGRKVA